MALPQNPPVTNKAAAEKNKAANAIHMQEQFKAGSQPKDSGALAKLGAAFTGQQAQQDVAAAGVEAASDVADIAREQEGAQLDQASQNIKDQEQLDQAIENQKNRIVEMGIGISEDEFATELQIQKLNEDQNYWNETAVMDQARMQLGSDEEYAKALQLSQQRIKEEIADSQYRLDVYVQAENDKDMQAHMAKDTKMREQMAIAKRAEEERIKKAKNKLAKQGKMMAAAKIVVGASAMYYTGGAVGGNLVAEGGKEATAAEGQG